MGKLDDVLAVGAKGTDGLFVVNFWSSIFLAVPISMVAVGAAYDEQTECKLPAAHVLKVLGGVGIVFGLLFMFTFIIGRSDAIIVVYALSRFVKLILQIWGSILIFGPYNDWLKEGDDPNKENFCHKTPYMFAFVMLIINWVLGLFVP